MRSMIMSHARDEKITTEQEARKAANRLFELLQKNIPDIQPKKAEKDHKIFALPKEELDDFTIVELINHFPKVKHCFTSDEQTAFQKTLNQVVDVLKKQSPTFLLAYEANVYRQKFSKANEAKNLDKKRLHAEKCSCLELYRLFLLPPGDETQVVKDYDDKEITFGDGKKLTLGNNDQHVKDRIKFIEESLPNAFKGILSHTKSVVMEAEALYSKKYRRK